MAHAPPDTLSRRHAAIRRTLASRKLDALVVTSLPNILYLTNFSGSAAILVLTPDRIHFITDFRYLTVMETSGLTGSGPGAIDLGFDLIRVDSSYDETLLGVLKSLPGARVGFEAAHLTVSRYQWLDAGLRPRRGGQGGGRHGPTLVPTDGIVERARVRKDTYEVSILREAGRRLSAAASEVIRGLARDQRERDVASTIDWQLRRAGFDRCAFETIVASGPNAALPHASPGERRLTEGDLIVLDFGGVYDSYCVDLTRTVSVGPPSARARDLHAAVLEAHDRAIEAVRPGRPRFDIDAAARRVLETRGLGGAFGHGTGHGLGIEVHEDPRITWRRDGRAGRVGRVGQVGRERLRLERARTRERGERGWAPASTGKDPTVDDEQERERTRMGAANGIDTRKARRARASATRRTGPRDRTPADASWADIIEAGMVFTIEPGAYLPGFGGVRIEDDVLVTETGVELLTNVRADLVEI